MVTQKNIEDFLTSNSIGIVGVSTDKKKFGYIVFKNLKDKGYNVIPIHPKNKEVLGCNCYSSLEDIPNKPDGIVIITKPEVSEKIIAEAIKLGIKNIWLQKNAENENIIALAEKGELNIIYGQCIMMHTQPKGIHKFHRNINKLFGKLPK